MPAWEFAAIVGRHDDWALRRYSDPVQFEIILEVVVPGDHKSIGNTIVSWFEGQGRTNLNLEIREVKQISPHKSHVIFLCEDVWYKTPKQLSSQIGYIRRLPELWARMTHQSFPVRNKSQIKAKVIGDYKFEPIFEAADILALVNLAGAEGWEITGGLGLADGSPGYGHEPPKRETKWRMMRREL